MTDTLSEKIAAIKAGLEGVPEGEWAYRPFMPDDWGTIRLSADVRRKCWILAQCRTPYTSDAELSRHRADGTDPYQRLGKHIARLDPRTVGEIIARLETFEASVAFTLSDPARLLTASDVQGICPDTKICFEGGATARCQPCASKAARRAGVQCALAHSSLPEVNRLRRSLQELEMENNRLREALSDCAAWFKDYGDGHTAKGDADKAKRNYDRERRARAALESKL